MTDTLFELAGLERSLQRALAAVAAETGVGTEPGEAAAGPAALPPVELTAPARPEFGDLSTSVALAAAGRLGRKPRDLAEELGRRWLAGDGAGVCARYEVAGPGFLNLHLSPAWYLGAVATVVEGGAGYGRDVLPPDRRRRLNIEFVSVNPTGPLHVGHARYAAYGDALCRLASFAGHDVTREFYVNDYGTQILRFAQSLAARYAQQLGVDMAVPADGYQGDYVADLAARLVAEVGDRHRAAVEAAAPDATALPAATVDEIKLWGRDAVLALFRATLERLRVAFDVWTSETSLYEGGEAEWRGFRGEVGKALVQMDEEGHLYDADGAVWLKTTDYGDDKDRVLVRKTGEPTYFTSDIAYHRDKLDRGFEHLIDIWGADHHGYVSRMKAAFTALPPHDPDRLELIIGQLVNLLQSGEAKRMSKRRGDIVTVDDLIDAIGVDAVRFFMVGRSPDSTLDLDLDLAVEESSKNPVYYVQYAHARICSILRNVDERAGGRPRADVSAVEPNEHEKALTATLTRFPPVVLEAVERRQPHRVHGYLGELAATFHVFYKHCRVLTDDEAVATLRTDLCIATRTILATGLALLGVEAPERM